MRIVRRSCSGAPATRCSLLLNSAFILLLPLIYGLLFLLLVPIISRFDLSDFLAGLFIVLIVMIALAVLGENIVQLSRAKAGIELPVWD